MTIRTGGGSALQHQSGLSRHTGDDSGQVQQARSDDIACTQLDSHAGDSQRGLQLSSDPIEQFTCDLGEQLSDPISSFDDAGAFGCGPEQDFGYDPSLGCSDHDIDKRQEC